MTKLPTCCEYHRADRMPGGSCNEGRACPEHTRRIQEDDIRWSREIGYESAQPVQFLGEEPKPARVDWRWYAVAAAVALLWVLVIWADHV